MVTMVSGLGGAAGYGENSFKTLVGAYDDSYTSVDLTSVFGPAGINFFGTHYTSLFLGTNGILTFNSGEASYSPTGVAGYSQPAIVPFWSDVHIGVAGDIYWDVDPAAGTLIITWDHVAAYAGNPAVTNSFQVVLRNSGNGNFTVDFNYQEINWTDAAASQGMFPTVGVTDGGGIDYELEGSGNDAFLRTYAGNDFDVYEPTGVWAMSVVDGSPVIHDGIVAGTAGDDLIDVNYLGDPGGDRVDFNDATGYLGTSGNDDVIFAGTGNDTVIAGDGKDQIYGEEGNDSIAAGAGDDTVSGGVDNDTLAGEDGNDIVYGGDGDDVVSGGAGDDTLYGEAGNDILTGGAGDDYMEGGSGNDLFAVSGSGDEGHDTVYGGDGYDVLDQTGFTGGNIVYTQGIEEIRAGDNNPGWNWTDYTTGVLYYGGITTDSVIAGSGNDTLFGGADNDTLNGGIGADVIVGDAGTDLLSGGDDADMIFGGAGDVVAGGEGGTDNDVLMLSDVDHITYGGGDNEAGTVYFTAASGGGTLSFSEIENLRVAGWVDGTAAGDSIGVGFTDWQGDMVDGADGVNDTIAGYAGDDSIVAGAGNDLVYGGDGNDAIGGWMTDSGDDTVYGDAGNDFIIGGYGDDVVYGGTGDDVLSGGGDNDTLYGGAGSDSFAITDDHNGDTIYGGEDAGSVDSLSFANWNSNQGVAVTFTGDEAGTYHFNGTTGSGVFAQIEAVNGTMYADTVDASADTAAVWIEGGAGNDTLTGGCGADTLNGGAGDDLIRLNDGFASDTITGGETGETTGDVVNTAAVTAAVTVTFSGAEAGTISDGSSIAQFSEIEAISLGSGNDTVYGGTGNDSVSGGAGDELMSGGAGNDTLAGDSGKDVLSGGSGNDLLYGGADADTLWGGAGDWIDGGETTTPGGTDNDVLVVEAGSTITYGGGNNESGTVNLASGGTLGFSGIEHVVFAGPVDGTSGNDLMTPGYTDANGDQIDGADGVNDAIYGYAGDDIIVAGAGNDSVYGGVGRDQLQGGVGDDSLSGDAGQDTLWGDQGADTISGGTGDDTILLADGFGNDVIQGGEDAGNVDRDIVDTTAAAGGVNVVFTGVEMGTISQGGDTASFAEIEQFNLGAGNDTVDARNSDVGVSIHTAAGDDIVQGGNGNDILDMGAGADTAIGGAGDDFYDLGANDCARDVIVLADGSGADAVKYFEAPIDNGDGTFSGKDQLDVTGMHDALGRLINVNDVVVTDDGAGNAVLHFPNGEQITLHGVDAVAAANPAYLVAMGIPTETLNFVVEGSSGNDYIDAGYTGDPQGDMIDAQDALNGSNDDVVFAGSGNDSVFSGYGNDQVYGGTGDDLLQTGLGNDTIYGEAGNDCIFSENGADVVYGGAGDDTAYASMGGDLVYGGDGNDVLTGGGLGSDPGDTLFGDAGNDTLTGWSGRDLLDGGADNDTFLVMGALDGDTMIGGEAGSDFDRIDLSSQGVGVTVNFTGNEAGEISQFGAATDTFSEIEAFTLTDQADVFNADATNNGVTVSAGGGADKVFGGAGNDSLLGDGGNDWIEAGRGADTVSGGAGNDSVSLGQADGMVDTVVFADGGGSDVLTDFETPIDNGDGTFTGRDQLNVAGLHDASGNPVNTADVIVSSDGAGNAVLHFPNGETISLYGVDPASISSTAALVAMGIPVGPDLIVDGTTGNDLMMPGYTDAGGDQVDGLDGLNDTIKAYAGNDLVYAGDGSDLVYGGLGDDALVGDAGNDTLLGELGNDVIQGGLGNDSALGGDGNDDIDMGSGNDVADGGDGNDLLFGWDGNDTLFGGATGDDTIYGGAGDDQISGGVGSDTLIGDEGNDTIHGDDGNDLIQGGNNDDVIYAGAGADDINAGDGNDSVGAGDGNDLIFGLGGQDTIDAGAGDDFVYAGVDDDVVIGGDGNDTLLGEDGNDALSGGTGDDSLNGGAGDDSVDGGVGNDTLYGLDGNDQLVGDVGNDSLFGWGDNDTLFGGAGDDMVDGDEGNDRLYGGAGSDTLVGDAGNDLILGGDDNDQIYAGTGDDDAYGGNGDDTLYADSGDDGIAGDAGNDVLYAGLGNDLLDGGSGTDSVFGEGGDDWVYGGSGNDLIAGGDGNDVLSGDAGDDLATGGAGNDTFYDGAGNDTMQGDDDRDVFLAGAGDVVDGGEGGDDYDVLDLTAYGHPATNIIYDPLNHENGTVEFLDNLGNVVGTMAFSNIEKIVACFTPGSMVLTAQGERAVEDLGEGDLVLTRDNGFQPIRWVGRRDLTAADLIAQPKFRPVRIAQGALGNGLPEREIMVSPQHRLLMTGSRAELLFGEHEVLVAATHMVGLNGIERVAPPTVSYIHILFDQHEVVRADGVWSESFQPGLQTMTGLEQEQRAEVLALFPELRTGSAFPAARLTLKAKEAKVLLRAS